MLSAFEKYFAHIILFKFIIFNFRFKILIYFIAQFNPYYFTP